MWLHNFVGIRTWVRAVGRKCTKNDNEEDEDGVKEENWSMGRRNNMLGSKSDSDETGNDRRTNELLQKPMQKGMKSAKKRTIEIGKKSSGN